ncbi:MAG: effector-associated domain EAD1-containing protein [Caldilineaceae bacterium]
MSLPGQQLDRICEAIRAAYTPESLARMVRGRLDVRLYDVAGGEDFRAVVFHLVEWVDRQQRLPQLVGAALAENPANRDLMEVAAALGIEAPAGDQHSAAPGPWYVPFERNPAFFGRAEDLQRLHAALAPRSRDGGQAIVGIRPAGVTGMGGMGKTQLAVEYAYRHRAEYPGGVFWLNAASDWRAEFAGLGVYLDVSRAGEPQEAQIRAAADYLQAHADCLLVLDNVEDPQQLRRPITRFLLPSALPCAVLFTTRRHDLGDFRPVELPVLPVGPGLQLLLRHPSRQAVLAEEHPEHPEALTIYAMLGGLPLALEIAGAHLGRRPAASLQAYREELLRRGALAVVDDPRGGVREEELGTRHAAAVAATLAEQWEGLGEDARLLLRAAGQLPEAAAIPLARLGLLTGLKEGDGDFFGASLVDAAGELVDASLLEDLRGDLVRLHPLVRVFAAQQTAEEEREGFRRECGARLIGAYDDLAVLEGQCALSGIDAVEQNLAAGIELLGEAGATEPIGAVAALLLRAVRQESHTLRGWDAGQNPALFRQQWLKRTMLLGEDEGADRARSFLKVLPCPNLEVVWTTAQSSTSLVRTLSGHTKRVTAVAVTPDGRHVISGSWDKTLRVWDLASGETVRTLSGHTDWVRGVAVTPDGRQVVSGAEDKTLRVWDLASGETVRTLNGHTDMVWGVAATPDGRQVVSGAEDKTLRVWDLAGDKSVRTLNGHKDWVQAVAVTPDGHQVVSGSRDKTLRVWDLASGETVSTLSGHIGPVQAVAVTPDGRQVVSSSDYNTLRVWNLASGETLRSLSGHTGLVYAVAVTPDGRQVISGSRDHTLREWDLASGETLRTLNSHGASVRALAVTPDGRQVVSGLRDNTLRVWDLASGETVRTLNGHTGTVRAVAVTPDGRQVVSGSEDNTLRVWDLASGETVRTLNGHTNSVRAVAVTPDGRHVVSGSRDNTLRVWNLSVGSITACIVLDAAVHSVAVGADGRTLVAGDASGNLWCCRYHERPG